MLSFRIKSPSFSGYDVVKKAASQYLREGGREGGQALEPYADYQMKGTEGGSDGKSERRDVGRKR